MIDAHHYAILEASGPKTWGHNITSSSIPSSALHAADLYYSAFYPIHPKHSACLSLVAMVKLQAAATILSHSIATRGGYDSARDIYDECRRTATILDNTAATADINTLDARDALKYSTAVYQVANTVSPDALTWLLVDIIRIATTLTKD